MIRVVVGLIVGVVASVAAFAQTAANLAALQGLSPVAVLANSPAGQAALAANRTTTKGIQLGTIKQPTLLPLAQQQTQALKDAFISSGNAAQLADALGTRLGGLYQAAAHYDTPSTFTNLSPAVATLFAYTNATTGSDSTVAKYFFANETTNGTTPSSPAAMAILAAEGGTPDVFGKAYALPAGSQGGNRFGNARPFQITPDLAAIVGANYFGNTTTNAAYLHGPEQNLVDNPSFPSGHTTYGTMESLVLALLVPERYGQEITRAAEYGNNRIILGAHYTMDVLAGRTLAMYDLAHLLANDPAYVGQARHGAETITDYPAALAAARADVTAALQAGCGMTVVLCTAGDSSRFNDPATNEAFYNATQTYGLPVVYPTVAASVEDVGTLAPEAGHLLTAAFPYLNLRQANAILTATEGPGGGFLDNGSAFGVYSRLNLYAAVKLAAALVPAAK